MKAEYHQVEVTGGEDQGRCDDPYCTGGHTSDTQYKCSCGWSYIEYGNEESTKRDISHIKYTLNIP